MQEQQLPPFEIYDVWFQPWWYHRRILIIVIALTVIFTLWSIRYIIRKRSKRRNLKPWEIALYKLHSLNSAHKDDKKIFYFELTYILKRYFSQRYNLDLEGKTDYEVINLLQQVQLPKDLIERMQRILHDSQMIKYAQEDVIISTMEHDLNRAIDIVRNSIAK